MFHETMHLIRIIPKHPGTLLSAAIGPSVMALLGIGSTWMTFSHEREQSEASFESILKVATLIAFVGIAATFTWIHVRKQRRYQEEISSLSDLPPTANSTGALASSLEPQLNWLVSTPDWEAVAKEIERHVELDQEGPVILCVGAIDVPGDIAPPVRPTVVRLWGPRIAYWMMLLAIVMLVALFPLLIFMSLKRNMPVNTLQIVFWGFVGLGAIVAGSHIRRLSGATRPASVELRAGVVEFVERKSRNGPENRRSYPLTDGTTVVFRVNPLYIGDAAAITLIRGSMTDTVSLSTKYRTTRLFDQILALSQMPQ